ncbi:YdcF family protein, partial [bacterium]|nr:YdcF family protein [bacterium]
RLTTVLPLLRQAPGLQVVFTGGEGEYFGAGLSEAERARRFFAQLGVDTERVLFESASRNTYAASTPSGHGYC